MTPGEVIWIDFPGVVQTKRRPAVILSSTLYHVHRPDLIVGLITSQTNKATTPTDYVLKDWRSAGLRVPSAFRAFLLTLPQHAVAGRMGSLTTPDWEEVLGRVQVALALR